jgi:cell division protein FtsZ
VLLNAVQGISYLMTVPGLINVDFADVRTIMSSMGRALMGTGIGNGKRRATEAAEMAISSPLLEDISIDGATGILINITGGPDLTLHEVNEASSLIQQAAHEDANIIFGSVIDPNLHDEVRITVIATGFDHAARAQTIVEPAAPTRSSSTSRASQQITMPYDSASQVTIKEYPPTPVPPRRAETRPPAQLVEEPEIHVQWDTDGLDDRYLDGSVDELDASARIATGSGPAITEGTPLVAPGKRAAARPSMKSVLSGEFDTESELDVPTFIRRHNNTQHG